MESRAEQFFGTVFVLAFLVLVGMTIATDEDFPWRVALPLRWVLADVALLVIAFIGLLAAFARNERATSGFVAGLP